MYSYLILQCFVIDSKMFSRIMSACSLLTFDTIFANSLKLPCTAAKLFDFDPCFFLELIRLLRAAILFFIFTFSEREMLSSSASCYQIEIFSSERLSYSSRDVLGRPIIWQASVQTKFSRSLTRLLGSSKTYSSLLSPPFFAA